MNNVLIGRKKEKEDLLDLFHSGRAEFITIYGRRRVGKTFLVNSLFADTYAFKATAVLDSDKQRQLRVFAGALQEYGSEDKSAITDWFAAFDCLRALLESARMRRKSCFWMRCPGLIPKALNLSRRWSTFGTAGHPRVTTSC